MKNVKICLLLVAALRASHSPGKIEISQISKAAYVMPLTAQ